VQCRHESSTRTKRTGENGDDGYGTSARESVHSTESGNEQAEHGGDNNDNRTRTHVQAYSRTVEPLPPKLRGAGRH
jgi:hypothetical protein